MREIQFREALREAMCEEMRKDENIFLMGEEVGGLQWCLQSEPRNA